MNSDLLLLVLFKRMCFAVYSVHKMKYTYVVLASQKKVCAIIKNYAAGENSKCLIYLLFVTRG